MTKTEQAPQYVALMDLPWGDGRLEKGTLVPIEDGRDYHQMERLGQIGHARASESGQDQEIADLNLLLTAIRTPGEALPEEFPSFKELMANGVRTWEGLDLLVSSGDPVSMLTRMRGIGKASAERILVSVAPRASGELKAEGGPPDVSS